MKMLERCARATRQEKIETKKDLCPKKTEVFFQINYYYDQLI